MDNWSSDNRGPTILNMPLDAVYSVLFTPLFVFPLPFFSAPVLLSVHPCFLLLSKNESYWCHKTPNDFACLAWINVEYTITRGKSFCKLYFRWDGPVKKYFLVRDQAGWNGRLYIRYRSSSQKMKQRSSKSLQTTVQPRLSEHLY